MASRKPARLMAVRQSTAVILEDMSKGIQAKLYRKDDCGLTRLAAIDFQGSRLLRALHWGGHLPFEDMSRGQCRVDPPFGLNQAPTTELIVSRLPTTGRPVLWDVVTYEIFPAATVGVTRNMNASSVCTPCCAAPFPFRTKEQIDFLAALAVINFQDAEQKTALKSPCWVFAVLEGKLHVSIVHKSTHVALYSQYGALTGIPALFKQSGD